MRSLWLFLWLFPVVSGTAAAGSGDLNGDAVWDAADYSLMVRWMCGSTELPSPLVADLDGNGRVDARDAVRLLKRTRVPPLCAGYRGGPADAFTMEYAVRAAEALAARFAPDAEPVVVWTVTYYVGAGDIAATFPHPGDGRTYPHVAFAATDRSEALLDAFDEAGVRVWLQVEPGAASMNDLVDLVLGRYGSHPCVVGFGVDVEWLDAQADPLGRPVTDAEAQGWEARVKGRKAAAALFLKHFMTNRMPPAYRGGILFVDDSQEFSGLPSMVNEFDGWGTKFAPNGSGFQVGYPVDRPWWSVLTDPPLAVGQALRADIPSLKTYLWVDFTLTEVVPAR